MITEEIWYIDQTDTILRSRFGKESNWMKKLDAETKLNNRFRKMEYIDIEEEIKEEAKVKEFAYSDVNSYKSERIENRITRELNQIDINKRIAKENEKTKLYWLFSFLFGKNENKDIVKKYRKEEKERVKRVRIFKEKELKKIKDRTPTKHYDYTVSTQKLHEDRNFGANHDVSKRKLKQMEVMKLQEKTLRKSHKILRHLKELKTKGKVTDNYLKSLTIYITDIISDIEPYEAIPILNELQKDAFINDQRKELIETDTDKLIRYMSYSNQLEALRKFGISYKNLVSKDKRELKELLKEKGGEI